MTRVTLNGADLHAAVAWAAGLCPARPSVPVLAGIRLDATDVGVRLSAFDWDTAGTVDASAWVTDPGSLLVSGRLLASVAKTVAKEADVTLTADPGAPVMTVSCGKAARWELPLIDLDDYPTLPTGGDPVGTVSADELGDALARVLPAVSGDVQPPSLRGVALSATADGPMILAATDRYRLAVAELDWTPSGGQAIDEVMVPTELFVAAMTAVSEAADGDAVTLTRDGGTLGIASGRHSVVGRLTGDQAPRWRQLLDGPKFAPACTVRVDALRQAIDRATVVVDQDAPLAVRTTDTEVAAAVHGAQRGSAEHTCPVVTDLDGGGHEFGVKPRYLLDAIAALRAPMVRLEHAGKAIRLVPVDEDGNAVEGYLHVVAKQNLPAASGSAAA